MSTYGDVACSTSAIASHPGFILSAQLYQDHQYILQSCQTQGRRCVAVLVLHAMYLLSLPACQKSCTALHARIGTDRDNARVTNTHASDDIMILDLDCRHSQKSLPRTNQTVTPVQTLQQPTHSPQLMCQVNAGTRIIRLSTTDLDVHALCSERLISPGGFAGTMGAGSGLGGATVGGYGSGGAGKGNITCY